MLVYFTLLTILIALSFYWDVTSMKIPNLLTYSAILAGIICHLVIHGREGFKDSLIGSAAGFAIMVSLYLFKAVGAGDVKLFAAIGALIGLEFVVYSSMYSIMYAGIFGLLILIYKRILLDRLKLIARTMLLSFLFRRLPDISDTKGLITFPFMYAVLPGVISAGFQIYG